jgi:hypothetical protein
MAMTLPDWTIIKEAFYAQLNGNVGATVYSAVPHNASYPFVDITDTTGFEDSAKDTFILRGTCGIEIVTSFKGQGSQKQMNDIASSVISIMRASTSGYKAITGYKIINMELDEDRNLTEGTDQNKIFRKLLRFRYIVVQN